MKNSKFENIFMMLFLLLFSTSIYLSCVDANPDWLKKTNALHDKYKETNTLFPFTPPTNETMNEQRLNDYLTISQAYANSIISFYRKVDNSSGYARGDLINTYASFRETSPTHINYLNQYKMSHEEYAWHLRTIFLTAMLAEEKGDNTSKEILKSLEDSFNSGKYLDYKPERKMMSYIKSFPATLINENLALIKKYKSKIISTMPAYWIAQDMLPLNNSSDKLKVLGKKRMEAWRNKQYDLAAEYQQQSIDIIESRIATDHTNLPSSYSRLGLFLKKQGKLEEAAQAYETAFDAQNSWYLKQDIPNIPANSNPYHGAHEFRKLRNIIECQQDQIEIKKKLGIIYTDMKKYEFAEKRFDEAFEIRALQLKLREMAHPVFGIEDNIHNPLALHKKERIRLYEAWGKSEKADEIRKIF